MQLDGYFDRLGFSSKERLTFLTLMERGKASATAIAKQLRQPRSTIFSILEALTEKGVVSMERRGHSTYFLPKAPESFIAMVETERRQLSEQIVNKECAAQELAKELKSRLSGQKYSIPKIQFFEGQGSVKKMLFENLEIWQKSVAKYDHTWWGYQDHEFVATYQDFIAKHAKCMTQEEKVWLFSNQSEIEKKLKGKISRRIIRLIPKSQEFSSTIWVLGDFVVTLMIRHKPHYAVVLHDPVFARNQRTQFQLLWDALPQHSS